MGLFVRGRPLKGNNDFPSYNQEKTKLLKSR